MDWVDLTVGLKRVRFATGESGHHGGVIYIRGKCSSLARCRRRSSSSRIVGAAASHLKSTTVAAVLTLTALLSPRQHPGRVTGKAAPPAVTCPDSDAR